MKRRIAVMLVLSMIVFALAGCGGGKDSGKETTKSESNGAESKAETKAETQAAQETLAETKAEETRLADGLLPRRQIRWDMKNWSAPWAN